jgi:hypothetical protein
MTISRRENVSSTLIEPNPAKRSAENSGGHRLWETLEKLANWFDARPKLLLTSLILIYANIALPIAFFKPLWHDELITYDLASLPSIRQMLHGIWLHDLNPPLLYFLDFIVLRIPGAHLSDHFVSLAARLPSILGGLIACVGLFVGLRRRVGNLYALALVCIYLNTTFSKYITEDRPYALVSGLIVGLILVWMRAREPGRSLVWVVFSLALGLAIMGTHFMSGPVMLAFFAATVVSGLSQRRIDLPLLSSFVFPFAIPLAYVAKISGYGSMVFPPAMQATWIEIPIEYALLLGPRLLVCGALLAVYVVLRSLLLSTVTAKPVRHPALSTRLIVSPFEWVLLFGILLQPAVAVLAIMRAHGAFFVRYGLPGCIAIAILITIFIYFLFNGSKSAALLVVFVSAMVSLSSLHTSLSQFVLAPLKTQASHTATPNYHTIQPDLPFVTASGLTYVEMNHREPVDFLRRVYYLTDTSAAIQYAHATLFENEDDLRRAFNYPSHVEPLRSFTAEHPRFLVLGTVNQPEDWLLRKLLADGEDVRLVGTFRTSYKDSDLYVVTIKRRQVP